MNWRWFSEMSCQLYWKKKIFRNNFFSLLNEKDVANFRSIQGSKSSVISFLVYWWQLIYGNQLPSVLKNFIKEQERRSSIVGLLLMLQVYFFRHNILKSALYLRVLNMECLVYWMKYEENRYKVLIFQLLLLYLGSRFVLDHIILFERNGD